MIISDETREKFEVWAAGKGMALHLDRGESGLYVSRVTQNYMDCWADSRVDQEAEIEALREFKQHMTEMREAQGFKSWAEVLVAVDKLTMESAPLRKDAERYRWFRDHSLQIVSTARRWVHDLDTEVDTAMAEQAARRSRL